MNDPITTQLTPASATRNGTLPAYISPVLQALAPRERPDPSPACETCPASLWFSSAEILQCYCSRMHLIVWERNTVPVLRCDGRELALHALRAALEAGSATGR